MKKEINIELPQNYQIPTYYKRMNIFIPINLVEKSVKIIGLIYNQRPGLIYHLYRSFCCSDVIIDFIKESSICFITAKNIYSLSESLNLSKEINDNKPLLVGYKSSKTNVVISSPSLIALQFFCKELKNKYPELGFGQPLNKTVKTN